MIFKKVSILSLFIVVMSIIALFSATASASYTKQDLAVERISPEDAREMVNASKALLVCAYPDDTCKSKGMLHGALLLSELEARLSSLPKDQKIIFYCG